MSMAWLLSKPGSTPRLVGTVVPAGYTSMRTGLDRSFLFDYATRLMFTGLNRIETVSLGKPELNLLARRIL
jgi:hypothetical protein